MNSKIHSYELNKTFSLKLMFPHNISLTFDIFKEFWFVDNGTSDCETGSHLRSVYIKTD